jgi:hypothetical protein
VPRRDRSMMRLPQPKTRHTAAHLFLSLLLFLTATSSTDTHYPTYTNDQFKRFEQSLLKFSDFKSEKFKRLHFTADQSTFDADPKKSQIDIAMVPESTGWTKPLTHEEYCLTVNINVMDLNDPNKEAHSEPPAPEEHITILEGATHCISSFPQTTKWNLKLQFKPLATYHAYVLEITIATVAGLPLTAEGMYTPELIKLNEATPFLWNYELMERDIRSNPEGGLHGHRRLYFMVKDDSNPTQLRLDHNANDFMNVDGGMEEDGFGSDFGNFGDDFGDFNPDFNSEQSTYGDVIH